MKVEEDYGYIKIKLEDLIKETPLYNFFIKKYRTGLSDV